MRLMRRRSLATLAALPVLGLPGLAWAQGFPSKPIRLVVPFTGGGATDITARMIGAHLAAALGQPVVIDNRAGAGGNIGADLVAKAEPDGHTLLMTTIGTASINQFLYKTMPFDAQNDFAAVSLVNYVANGVVVSPTLAARNTAELIALARARPGTLNCGTPGNGTSGHMCLELFKTRSGTDIQHVPFRGSALVINDLIGGRLDMTIDNLPAYLPHIREGRLRLLAVTSRDAWFTDPDVPTVGSTLPGFEAVAWFGVQAPARTPQAVIERLSLAVQAATTDLTVSRRLREIGSQPVGSTAAEFDAYIKAENMKWAEVVRVSGARID